MVVNNHVIGQVYTPDFIAEFMVNNCVKYFEGKKSIKILEPSVGKGVFLTYLLQSGLKNIVAYELDQTLKPALQENFPHIDLRFENVLGADLNEKFDLIIGNPPYLGQNYNAEIFQDYVKKYRICENYFVGNMDLFYYFIHLGIEKLNPRGILTFITTNYWITKSKKTGIKLLKPHILEECFLLQYIDLSNLTLFKGAEGQHNCIFVIQKKTAEEKKSLIDKDIEIFKIGKTNLLWASENELNKKIFNDIINNNESPMITKYISAIRNNDLKPQESWNLEFPHEVQAMVKNIENYCRFREKILLLKDYFLIRNGIIFIKDEIFILKEGENLQIKDKDFFIKIKDKFYKLNEIEIDRLKKIYKSKAIYPYGFNASKYIGYAIYFNREAVKDLTNKELIEYYIRKYPNLTNYLLQFMDKLREILINAKENSENVYFPRRGAYIRGFGEKNAEILINLENNYDRAKKIFFRFISNKNEFGYSEEPYYATSDTYFLWPKNMEDSIDYPFLLAYLNSKIVNFIFIAKNITIKRSKTKLENLIPIPYIELFYDPDSVLSDIYLPIIELIRTLSLALIEINNNSRKISFDTYLDYFTKKVYESKYFIFKDDPDFESIIFDSLEKRDVNKLKRAIDILFFQFFEIEEEEIDELIKNYYEF